jgi:hypothetical protein
MVRLLLIILMITRPSLIDTNKTVDSQESVRREVSAHIVNNQCMELDQQFVVYRS